MKVLVFFRLVDKHDGTLALPVLAFYVGVAGLALQSYVGMGLLVAALLAAEHKRRVNTKYDSRLQSIEALELKLKTFEARLDKTDAKLSRVGNKVAVLD